MGSLYKRVRTRNGKQVKDKKYSIKYRGTNGEWKQEIAYADRESSYAKLVQREREIARGEVGLADHFGKHRKRPLSDHLEDYCASVRAGGATEKYVKKIEYRLKLAFCVMDARFPRHLTPQAMEKLILHLKDAGRAPQTLNHYIDALRGFSNWGVKRERWSRDAFASVKKIKGKHDVRRKRRALAVSELEELVSAALTRAPTNYAATHPKASKAKLLRIRRQGENRAMAFRLAALAGLRFNEIKTLVWADVNFDRAPAQITIRAENAKSKREDRIPISDSLADMLLDWRKTQRNDKGRYPLPDERVVFIGSRFRDSFKKDLKAAGIPLKDAMECHVDMHALRHTFATLLAQNQVHPKVAQALLRHTDIRMTMAIYTHVGRDEQAKALESLPALSGDAKKAVQKVVTI